jgi:large repetitive protein
VILESEKTTLTASNCEENLLWNTEEKTASITVRPETNTIYSTTCDIWQCVSDTASVKVRVRPRPIEIETSVSRNRGYSITDTLCLNKQLTISTLTQCNGTIVWSNGQSGEKIELTGTRGETQKYILYCINADVKSQMNQRQSLPFWIITLTMQ